VNKKKRKTIIKRMTRNEQEGRKKGRRERGEKV
jgi:hypothetical protein